MTTRPIVVETFGEQLTNLIVLLPESTTAPMTGMDDRLRETIGGAPSRKVRARKIAEAFTQGCWIQGYVRGKLLGDPVFDVAWDAIQTHGGCVTDLGCGLGLFGLWLKSQGHAAAYRGCDLGGWKIHQGQAAALRLSYEGITLDESDMMEFPLEAASVICTFDVLHYLPGETQGKFIRRLAQAARSGSLVLLRNGMRECGWRSLMTLLVERWIRSSGWIRAGPINFPTLKSLVTEFEQEGCSVEVRPLWGKTPFSSYLLSVVSRH